MSPLTFWSNNLLLSELLTAHENYSEVFQLKDKLAILGLTCDSRLVKPGFLFAAFEGTNTDGSEFIGDAINRGAIVILSSPKLKKKFMNLDNVVWLIDINPRYCFAKLVAKFFDNQPEYVTAITGTNGKTSVACFLQQIWSSSGRNSASLGTLGIQTSIPLTRGTCTLSNNLTTPDPVNLHQNLAKLSKSGVTHIAIEASSHGLDQYRLDGLRIESAAFTNFSQDHLDFHGTESIYLASKLRLFSDLLNEGGTAVINADSHKAKTVLDTAKKRSSSIITFGKSNADICLLSEMLPSKTGQRLNLSVFGQNVETTVPLIGAFQIFNSMCALALAIASGVSVENALNGIRSLKNVRGRMELVGRHPSGAPIYVDYAHTPDALKNLLLTLKPFVKNKLSIVFGCGGDRDAKKRFSMGSIAESFADNIIVTDDNPRSEQPQLIRNAILRGCPSGKEIGNRKEAISSAIHRLAPGDILVVAGKGHEEGQIVHRKVLPFDDREEIKRSLEASVDE